MNKQRFILFSLIAVAVLQIMYYYPLLPSTVASHFDAAGNPNGCSSKKQFVGIYMFVILMMSFSSLALPLLLKNMPVSLINLPKKDYWLAPERRETTFLFIGETMLGSGNATILFLIITFQLSFEANLSTPLHFSSETMFILLGGYLLFISVWLARFIMRFRRTDTDEPRS
jgi:uncharacterized membrane protein